MRSGAQVDVCAGQRGEFGDPQAGLEGQGQQGVIAAPGRGGGVRGGQKCGGLGFGEVGDERAVEAFGWDGQDALDDGGVFGVVQGGESEQRVHCGQSGVSGTDTVAAFGLQMVEERPDQGRV